VHTIKKNENYPVNVYVPFDETRFAVSNEGYLSKVMQYHRQQLLELQNSVTLHFYKRIYNKSSYQKL
jgi:hypothetical protein